jgi:hypothetical protein
MCNGNSALPIAVCLQFKRDKQVAIGLRGAFQYFFASSSALVKASGGLRLKGLLCAHDRFKSPKKKDGRALT